MEFVDRYLKCCDCSNEFVFTAGEQLFFHDKQFKNDPKRCKPCKSRRSGLSAAANGLGPVPAGLSRTETRTECSECGVQTTVPFKPTQGRPVLCRQCFQAKNKAAATAPAPVNAPQATLPIFDFGKNAANLRYSKASRDLAVAQYEKAIQTGFKEVADALAQRATIDKQLAAQTAFADDASATLRLTELRYRTGVDQFLNVLDAQRTLYSAQQTLVTTRLTEQSNMVELYRSLGGGLR